MDEAPACAGRSCATSAGFERTRRGRRGRIRNLGPSCKGSAGKVEQNCLDEWVLLRGGTESSNPSLSSGESVSLPHPVSKVENPAFGAGVCGWLGDRVGRDAQGVSISRQPAAISLSGHIPVPQCH